jgi:hypothetical protein
MTSNATLKKIVMAYMITPITYLIIQMNFSTFILIKFVDPNRSPSVIANTVLVMSINFGVLTVESAVLANR